MLMAHTRKHPTAIEVGDVIWGVGTVAEVTVMDDPRWTTKVVWTDGGYTLYPPRVQYVQFLPAPFVVEVNAELLDMELAQELATV